jgi:hypothetical protein
MKKYSVSLKALEAEKMWDFVMKHDANVHFVSTNAGDFHPTERLANAKYKYEVLMSKETALVFALIVGVEVHG